MSLSKIKALTDKTRKVLEHDHWTIERLATATIRELVVYPGIGKATAPRIISEAMGLVNDAGVEDSERLAKENYYQKTPAWKIINDWEDEGMDLVDIALASAATLALVKGIGTEQALKLISKAGDIVNKRNLQSSMVATNVQHGGPAASAAFDEDWLSGKKEPPSMAKRVERNFERAKADYEANH